MLLPLLHFQQFSLQVYLLLFAAPCIINKHLLDTWFHPKNHILHKYMTSCPKGLSFFPESLLSISCWCIWTRTYPWDCTWKQLDYPNLTSVQFYYTTSEWRTNMWETAPYSNWTAVVYLACIHPLEFPTYVCYTSLTVTFD